VCAEIPTQGCREPSLDMVTKPTLQAVGLSPGYLGRLRAGPGHPSPMLCAALFLWADDPARLDERSG